MIPKHEENGNLPNGIHNATYDEVYKRFGYNPKRLWLLEGLKVLLDHLRQAGCSLVYLDGSFVTSKDSPNDYDLCWSIHGVDSKKLDPALLNFDPENRNTVSKKYRGDIFPAEIPEGISGKLFLNFFQTDKNTGDDKGIIGIML